MGLSINVSYDPSVSSAPAEFKTAVAAAVLFYEHAFTNNITINIDVGYGEVNGSPISSGNIAQSRFTGGGFFTYLQVKNALSNNVSSADDAAAVASLPANDPTNGAAFLVSPAEEKALSLPALMPTVDGYIGVSSTASFSWDPNNRAVPGLNDGVGVIEHEISEVMGRLGSLGKYQGQGVNYTPMDLFRYSSPGIRDLTPGPGYFSIDGQTLLTAYNNPLNGGDPADWIPSLQGDSYGTNFAGVVSAVLPTDLRVMNLLGYNRAATLGSLFNATYYLNQNPDVAASGMDPLTHYEKVGWKEGRDPNDAFSINKYLQANADVAMAHVDPLLHYLNNGQYEGRMAFIATPHGVGPQNPLVDNDYYFSRYADVRAVGIDPFAHYDLSGWKEGRDPDALFDTRYYLQQNSDVAAAGIDPLLHYERSGWKEGRDPSAQFSTSKYLAAYSDVKAAGIDPLIHYEQHGMLDGRTIFHV